MDQPATGPTHLHLEDYPATLALLAELLQPHHPATGYEPTEHGARIDWDQLARDGDLTPAEIAVLHIAHGAAGLERSGGAPPRLSHILRTTVATITP